MAALFETEAMGTTETHRIAPVLGAESRILILGSFPSVKSREAGFYYAHPQNRFWRVLSAVYGEALPLTTDEKKQLLQAHGLALWDVIASCRIRGSSDGSVTDVAPNDLSAVFSVCPVERVLINGRTAEHYYRRYALPLGYPEPLTLPSTSPANAAWSLARLIEAWKKGLLF